jgi:hypothetical protein
MDDRRQDTRRDDRNEDHWDLPADRIEERRDDRQDYYDDRREYYDDRYRYSRGMRYSATWWAANSCSQVVVVELDGYSYYECNNAWFGRTYYGGEVTYTVVDAPEEY